MTEDEITQLKAQILRERTAREVAECLLSKLVCEHGEADKALAVGSARNLGERQVLESCIPSP